MVKKVLLVYPHNSRQGNYHSVPTGLLFIHAMLREHGIECDWVDGCVVGFEGIKAKIDEYMPDIVGVSSLTLGRHPALEVAQYAKNKHGMFTILGGAHVGIMYEQVLLNYPYVDTCCTDPGEYTMLELARGTALPFIPSLAWRDGSKVHYTTEKLDYELDDLPFPRWAEVPFEKYIAPGAGMGGGRAVWSRGCKWGKCLFCAVDPVWKRYKVRTPENMMAELWALTDAQFPYTNQRICSFADDLFSGDLERTKDLLRLMISEEMRLAFDVTTRVDYVDEELIQLLVQAGCYEIRLGIETAHPEALRVYAKGASMGRTEQVVGWCRAHGLRVCALLIYGGIRAQEFDPATRRWAAANQDIGVGSANELQIFPGTPLCEAMKDHGVFSDDFWLGPQQYGVYRGELDHLTAEDWRKYR